MERKEYLISNPNEITKTDLTLFGNYDGFEIQFKEEYFGVIVNCLNENFLVWNVKKYGDIYLARVS
jgi:hypothetical protein